MIKKIDRNCIECDAKIIKCDGFVIAGDYLDYMNGKRTKMCREICGRCAVKYLFKPFEGLPKD